LRWPKRQKVLGTVSHDCEAWGGGRKKVVKIGDNCPKKKKGPQVGGEGKGNNKGGVIEGTLTKLKGKGCSWG